MQSINNIKQLLTNRDIHTDKRTGVGQYACAVQRANTNNLFLLMLA